MSEGLHDPKPIQNALEPHARRLRETACGICGDTPTGDEEGPDFAFYVMPSSNGMFPTPQLVPMCDGCAMEVAEMTGDLVNRSMRDGE